MTNREQTSSNNVDELLLDAGHSDAPELRLSLLRMHSLAQLPVPAPSAELELLLDGGQDALAHQRRLRKHRPTVVGVAVIAGMGLGVTGVAATSPAPRIGQGLATMQELTGGWTPAWMVPLGPAHASVAPPLFQPDAGLEARGTGEVASSDSTVADAPGGTASEGDASEVAGAPEGVASGGVASGGATSLARGPVPLNARALNAAVLNARASEARALNPRASDTGAADEDSGTELSPGTGDRETGAKAGRQPSSVAAVEQLQYVARHLADTVPRGRQGGRHVAETRHKGPASAVEAVGGWLQKLHR